jgi:hypothetical protein
VKKMGNEERISLGARKEDKQRVDKIIIDHKAKGEVKEHRPNTETRTPMTMESTKS